MYAFIAYKPNHMTPKAMRLHIIAIAALVAFDQIIKYCARRFLSFDSYIEVIPNFIHLTYRENKGISFSMLADLPSEIRAPLLTGFSAVVIAAIVVYVFTVRSKLNSTEKWGFSLVLAGAFSNLLDRAIRQSVTDYMYFHFYDYGFFVNNFADDIISVGFVLLLLGTFSKKSAPN